MEQIPDPLESQEPMEKEPQDDQLLDELERSIENPAGFKNPLASHDRQFMDDLAKQLDGLEASIEDTSQSGHGTLIVPDDKSTAPQDGGPVISDAVSEEECGEPEDTSENSQAAHDEGQSDGKDKNLQFPPQQRFRGKPILRGRRRHLFRRRGPATTRRRIARRQGNRRFCPESHEVTNVRECESCEKYRHWPGGTDEEPRECWYDWQAKPPSNEPDGDEK